MSSFFDCLISIDVGEVFAIGMAINAMFLEIISKNRVVFDFETVIE